MIKVYVSACVFEQMFRQDHYEGPRIVTDGIPPDAELVSIEPSPSYAVGKRDFIMLFDDGKAELTEKTVLIRSFTAEEVAGREDEFYTVEPLFSPKEKD